VVSKNSAQVDDEDDDDAKHVVLDDDDAQLTLGEFINNLLCLLCVLCFPCMNVLVCVI